MIETFVFAMNYIENGGNLYRTINGIDLAELTIAQ
jgi:hypothetical protein